MATQNDGIYKLSARYRVKIGLGLMFGICRATKRRDRWFRVRDRSFLALLMRVTKLEKQRSRAIERDPIGKFRARLCTSMQTADAEQPLHGVVIL